MNKAIEFLQKAEGEMQSCNCMEKKKDENINLQGVLEESKKQTEQRKSESEKIVKSLAEKNNQLINAQEQLKETEQKLADLGIEEKNKIDKITSLTSSLGKSEIEVTELKKATKQDELDKLTDELNISRDFKKRLKSDYERLVKAKKNQEEDIIDEAEENINEIKEELKEKGISRDNIRKICELHEKVAKLQLDLKQARNQLWQHEAKIETNLPKISK
jgi:hypothetical protein